MTAFARARRALAVSSASLRHFAMRGMRKQTPGTRAVCARCTRPQRPPRRAPFAAGLMSFLLSRPSMPHCGSRDAHSPTEKALVAVMCHWAQRYTST